MINFGFWMLLTWLAWNWNMMINHQTCFAPEFSDEPTEWQSLKRASRDWKHAWAVQINFVYFPCWWFQHVFEYICTRRCVTLIWVHFSVFSLIFLFNNSRIGWIQRLPFPTLSMDQETALHLAASSGDINSVEELIKAQVLSTWLGNPGRKRAFENFETWEH